MNAPLRLGTRGSRLALTQAEQVRDALKAKIPERKVSLEIIKTTGDQVLDRSIGAIGTQGVFVKELDDALLAKKIDLAAHSLKDLPSALTTGVELSAVLNCEDPRDALVAAPGMKLKTLPAGSRVGTSSLRRAALLRRLRPDLKVLELRGNVDTRLRKFEAGDYDAVVVACAGLKRLGLADRAAELLDPTEFLPCIGQGMLAVTCRSDDKETRALLARIDEPERRRLAEIERRFMARMEGGCLVPLGCHAEVRGKRLSISAFIASPTGPEFVEGKLEGNLSEGDRLADDLAASILSRGGKEILREIETASRS